MFGLIKDAWRCRELKAKTELLLREQMLKLVEKQHQAPLSDEAEGWTPLANSFSGRVEIQHLRQQARDLVDQNPHARIYLRLLEIYVIGSGFKLSPIHHQDIDPEEDELTKEVCRLWDEFLRVNAVHYSFREHARRTWRDGECFIRKFEQVSWPPHVRFTDPELIGDVAPYMGTQGVVTLEDDVETPLYYLLLDRTTATLREEISAEEIHHTKYGVDTNEKRGRSVLLALIEPLKQFEKWLDTELQARKLQTSIVLWRKVQGSANQLSGLIDANASAGMSTKDGTTRKEKIKPGSILTTSMGTEMKFLQPDTNFSDAVPLGRMLLLCMSAGAGVPEFMLTSDAANANLASTLVSEGPAAKFFESEQEFFTVQFNRLWRWVMQSAIDEGLLPEDLFARVEPKWTLPKIVVHNRSAERLADTRLVAAEILSKAEVARRDGVEPDKMRREIKHEQTVG